MRYEIFVCNFYFCHAERSKSLCWKVRQRQGLRSIFLRSGGILSPWQATNRSACQTISGRSGQKDGDAGQDLRRRLGQGHRRTGSLPTWRAMKFIPVTVRRGVAWHSPGAAGWPHATPSPRRRRGLRGDDPGHGSGRLRMRKGRRKPEPTLVGDHILHAILTYRMPFLRLTGSSHRRKTWPVPSRSTIAMPRPR